MVPHLTTALTGPLLELERHFLDHRTAIEQWFRGQWLETAPPFYGSTDLRNSGFKLAPVDLNLFPGGFNNLNEPFLPLCVQAAQAAIERICPDARRVLLIPENHTRNQFYLQNVAQLVAILRLTGLEVRLGSLLHWKAFIYGRSDLAGFDQHHTVGDVVAGHGVHQRAANGEIDGQRRNRREQGGDGSQVPPF